MLHLNDYSLDIYQNMQQRVSIPHALQIAQMYQRTGQLQQAETIYRQVLQLEPDNISTKQLLGTLAWQVGKYHIAIELIETTSGINNMPPMEAYRNEWEGISPELIPNFVIMGAMKSGTTSLYHSLRKHPDVYFKELKKELGLFLEFPNYIDKAKKKGLTISSRSDLLSVLLEQYSRQKMIGESSTYYTKFPFQGVQTPALIKCIQPNMKFIYILRNPLERMTSHYLHYLDHFKLTKRPDFNSYMRSIHGISVFWISCYYFQLARFLYFFPKEQFKIVTMETLRDNPVETIHSIFEFLEIDRRCSSEQSKLIYNKSNSRNFVDERTLRFESDLFNSISFYIKKDIHKLETLLDRKFQEWNLSDSRWRIEL